MQFCLLASTVDVGGTRRLEPSDRAAVHFALQSDQTTVAVCPGDDPIACEFAIAAGVGTILPAESTPEPEFELAWAGIGFAERLGEKFLAGWAEHRSAQLLFDVLACGSPTDGVRTVVCDAGRGVRDELHVRGPCVLVISMAVARSPYVSQHRRRAARRHSAFASISPTDPTRLPEWLPARPRVRTRMADPALAADDRMDAVFAIEAGSASSSQHVIVADAESCARHMLRYLAHHSFLPQIQADVPRVAVAVEPATVQAAASAAASRSLPASLQRRPRWPGSGTSCARGPFWCDSCPWND